MPIDLSVLICSTNTRSETFGRAIQEQVWPQYDALPVKDRERIEILMLTDNKKMMLGHKRNVMVDMAQGRYVQFIDDDDRIEPDMFRTVLAAIDSSNADVVTFLAAVSLNGQKPKICHYSKDFTADRNTSRGYERLPNHICCVKRELARQVSFPNILYGEDSAYAKLLRPLLKTEHHIPRVLYHYLYNIDTTETQTHLRNEARIRDGVAPIVDVVVLSNAINAELMAATQTTIQSCLAGANSLPVGITVMEQTEAVHKKAATIRMYERFNYNRFANIGAARGSADWIMIANNDLNFHDGWLHHLLAADHPLVSPKCPNDKRQTDITDNTVGDITGRHLSGWCFMISRQLWEKIGGFDEDVSFWCSDDVVIEQCAKFGVKPMLVPAAQVDHVQSKTLKKSPNRDDLTWKQLDIFISKYGGHRLQNHPDYLRWKQSC